MPDLATLVFLCNCLRSSPCMLGFANGVGLGLECMYLHTAVECVLFVAEIDSHDSYLIEMEGCALTVDMSLRLKDGCSRTFDREFYPSCKRVRARRLIRMSEQRSFNPNLSS